jgi:hypothetical protein
LNSRAILALLLWLAVIAGWTRSHFRSDDISHIHSLKATYPESAPANCRQVSVISSGGGVGLTVRYMTNTAAIAHWSWRSGSRPVYPEPQPPPRQSTVAIRIPTRPTTSPRDVKMPLDVGGELKPAAAAPVGGASFTSGGLSLAPPLPHATGREGSPMSNGFALGGNSAPLPNPTPAPPPPGPGSVGNYIKVGAGTLSVNFFTSISFPTPTHPPGALAQFLHAYAYRFDSVGNSGTVVILPYWMLALTTTLLLAVFSRLTFRAHRRHRRLSRGLCIDCGYDLRESPQRCPECGASAA